MMKRAALFGAAALLLLAVHAPHVDAATASPILTSDNDEIEFAKDEEGSQTATLTITNPSTDVVTLEIIGREEIKDCGFKVEPSSVPARRTVSVSITTNSCPFPDDGAIASLIAGGTEAASLTLKSAHPKEPLELDRIFEDLLVAALGAAIAMVVVYLMRPSVSGTKVQATDEVAGVDAGWSFADSWATNISAFATVFVALLGSTEVLTAVLGEEPDDFVGRVLVAGAISAFLTGAAPLALKAIGKTPKPTVGGLLIGGFLTVTGVASQLITIGWAIGETSLDTEFRDPAAVLGGVGAVMLLWYGARTLLVLLNDSFKQVPDDPIAAEFFVAAATSLGPGATPQQIADRAKALTETPPTGASPSYPPIWFGTSQGDGSRRSGVL